MKRATVGKKCVVELLKFKHPVLSLCKCLLELSFGVDIAGKLVPIKINICLLLSTYRVVMWLISSILICSRDDKIYCFRENVPKCYRGIRAELFG